ncbi:ATP-binding cassette domain-containing protein [Streptomyces sp. SP17BM10]|uniref:ATP-binding cassette domain-containing protein n=1 Tax=Streptomyces sp. SP17BM10 TaxID=3002530 RepID=UPI002E7A9B70|nr:ATP-binding cassette domain-containing protein [Streptomyces sp. SP17BM10]MEE1782934.1 ATP-binding cassette domain-containing protein [Streptomyces sp. SP17BM10]
MTNAPVIDLRDTTKKYDGGPPALADVTWPVASGECVAILGHSGSGTSTLPNLIAGPDEPSSSTEPTGALDSSSVEDVRQLLLEPARRDSDGLFAAIDDREHVLATADYFTTLREAGR